MTLLLVNSSHLEARGMIEVSLKPERLHALDQLNHDLVSIPFAALKLDVEVVELFGHIYRLRPI